MGYACGDFFPQIEPVKEVGDNIDNSWLDGGLMFRVSNGFKSPDQNDFHPSFLTCRI